MRTTTKTDQGISETGEEGDRDGARPSIRYQLDAEDRILSVCQNWREFAHRNGASNLELEMIVGRPIWEFVAGDEARHLNSLLFATARASGRPVSFPFRCDAPDCRRYLRLEVRPLPDDALDVHAATVLEEPRPFVALLDDKTARSSDFLSICSWCKCVLLPGGEWVEVETAVRRLDLFGSHQLPQLSHGVCADCESRIDAEINAEINAE